MGATNRSKTVFGLILPSSRSRIVSSIFTSGMKCRTAFRLHFARREPSCLKGYLGKEEVRKSTPRGRVCTVWTGGEGEDGEADPDPPNLPPSQQEQQFTHRRSQRVNLPRRCNNNNKNNNIATTTSHSCFYSRTIQSYHSCSWCGSSSNCNALRTQSASHGDLHEPYGPVAPSGMVIWSFRKPSMFSHWYWNMAFASKQR